MIFFTETPFEFVDSHVHLIGWPLLVYVCWLVRGRADKFLRGMEMDRELVKETYHDVATTKEAVDAIQNTHLTAVEQSVQALGSKQDATIVLLTSIDKGIGVLVDRDRRNA